MRAQQTTVEKRVEVWLGRAVLAGRVARWWCWTIAGWPVTVLAVWVALWLAWLPVWAVLPLGLATDWIFGLVYPSFASWRMGCRWRRRWPSVWRLVAKASDAKLDVVPRLGLVPRLGPSSIAWTLRPPGGGTLADVVSRADQVAAADPAVVLIDIEWHRSTDSRGVLLVAFADELEKVEEPQWVSY